MHPLTTKWPQNYLGTIYSNTVLFVFLQHPHMLAVSVTTYLAKDNSNIKGLAD